MSEQRNLRNGRPWKVPPTVSVVVPCEPEHEWMELGGPGDEWRECFLCGKQEDR